MTQIIKPAPGRRIRLPDQRYNVLAEEGSPVEWGSYYEQLLSAGDIEIVTESGGEDD